MRYVLNVVLAGVPTIAVGMWLIKYVTNLRGYEAIGGEWILIVGIFTALYFLIDRLMQDYRTFL